MLAMACAGLVLGLSLPTAAQQIDALNPSIATPGATVTVEGQNFLPGGGPNTNSVIIWDGNVTLGGTQIVSQTELTFQVPNGASCGPHDVQVKNFNPDGTSSTETLRVFCVSGIAPAQGSPGTTVTVNGGGFTDDFAPFNGPLTNPGSHVELNGQRVTTTFVDGQTLEFTLPSGSACGTAKLQVIDPPLPSLNPALPSGNPRVSNTVQFNVTQPCGGAGGGGGGGSNQPPNASFSVGTASPSVNQSVQFTNNSSDPEGDPLSFQWDFGDGDASSNTSPSHTYNSAGSFTVQLTVTDNNGNSDTASQTINVQASSGGGGGGSGQGGLSQYDTNPQNCRIDQAELIVMIDDWINGNIPQSLLLDGINAWIDQADICAGSSGLASPSLEDVRVQSRSTAAGVLFSAQTDRALDVRSMEVRIFGLDGRPIARKQANRGTLAWNLTTDDGDRIANGVYLYRVTVTGPTGNVERGQMRKLTVLR